MDLIFEMGEGSRRRRRRTWEGNAAGERMGPASDRFSVIRSENFFRVPTTAQKWYYYQIPIIRCLQIDRFTNRTLFRNCFTN